MAGGLAAIYPVYHFDVYDWIRQMITALGYCPAAAGYHAYPSTLDQLQSGLTKFRQALDDVGCPATGIELNEFYVVGGDPALMTQALEWIIHSHLGVSRVILSTWCGRDDRMLGPPAETLDGTIRPSGWAFLNIMNSPLAQTTTPSADSGSERSSSAPAQKSSSGLASAQRRRARARAHHRRSRHARRRDRSRRPRRPRTRGNRARTRGQPARRARRAVSLRGRLWPEGLGAEMSVTDAAGRS